MVPKKLRRALPIEQIVYTSLSNNIEMQSLETEFNIERSLVLDIQSLPVKDFSLDGHIIKRCIDWLDLGQLNLLLRLKSSLPTYLLFNRQQMLLQRCLPHFVRAVNLTGGNLRTCLLFFPKLLPIIGHLYHHVLLIIVIRVTHFLCEVLGGRVGLPSHLLVVDRLVLHLNNL